jgi:hypothetical protein
MKAPISGKNVTPISAVYGYPEEWAAFSALHQEFLKRFENIDKAISIAFDRVHETAGPLEKVIYFHGRLVAEEFMEVLLLCGNGYGIGGQKLVRGMYERAVTARYLMVHPEEVSNFLDFSYVARHKLLIATERTGGQDIVPPEQATKIREDYERVKSTFMISDCKTCGTLRLNHSWSKADIVSMAQSTKNLWPLVVSGYYVPMLQGHSTLGAIFSRLGLDDDALLFDGDSQRNTAHNVLSTAHIILLDALTLQRDHFQIQELEAQLQICMNDYEEIWKANNGT